MADRFVLRRTGGGSYLRGGDLLRLLVVNATSTTTVTGASSTVSVTAAVTSTPSVT